MVYADAAYFDKRMFRVLHDGFDSIMKLVSFRIVSLRKRITPGETPWINGIRLAAINAFLSLLFIITFIGVIEVGQFLSEWIRTVIGDPRFYLPFPIPWILLLYVVILLVVWVMFARRLKVHARCHLLLTALIGSTPFFVLSLLGYASVGWMLAFGDFNSNQMLVASVWVYGMISTLIFLAGITCVLVITLVSK